MGAFDDFLGTVGDLGKVIATKEIEKRYGTTPANDVPYEKDTVRVNTVVPTGQPTNATAVKTVSDTMNIGGMEIPKMAVYGGAGAVFLILLVVILKK